MLKKINMFSRVMWITAIVCVILTRFIFDANNKETELAYNIAITIAVMFLVIRSILNLRTFFKSAPDHT